MGPLVFFMLASGIFLCVLAPVNSQCTTKYCADDDKYDNVLTAMVARLQETVEQLRGEHRHSLEQLRLDHQRSTEQLQRQLNLTAEQLRHDQERSTAQLQQQFNLTAEQLRHDQERSTAQLQQQFNFTAEQLHKDQERSTEQIQQQLNHSVVEQQKHVTRLDEIIASRTENARDCADLLKKGYRTSGVYYIYIAKLNRKFKVFCDQETDNGEWTVFQKRQDGSVDFNRDWKHYKEGFGNVAGEYWLGNDYLHEITSQANYTLRVDLTAFNGTTRYAVYSTFTIADEAAKYRLSVSGYHGTAGDSMRYENGMVFSTKDRDNDRWSTVHCAVQHRGAWWYALCSEAFLNGEYQHNDRRVDVIGIHWLRFSGYYNSLQKSEMKIRPT